jgi:predicted LPLAT superfamily acyltransferase
MARQREAIDAGDVKKAAMLLSAIPVAWLVPPRFWGVITRPLCSARFLFDRPPPRLPPGLVDLLGGAEARAVAQLRQSYLEACLRTLRAWAPGSSDLSLTLSGRQHLGGALEAGKGAIVWVAQTCCASVVAKLALHEAGFALAHLSRPSHPFSATRFGIRFLNPIQTGIEARYIDERLTMTPGAETATLLRARRLLTENRVLSITAAGPGAERVSVAFLGGALSLPAGALRLSMMTAAPVLPVFVLRTGAAAFEVHIEPPLTIERGDDRSAAYQAAASEWAQRLEGHLSRRPEVWQGWLAAGGE